MSSNTAPKQTIQESKLLNRYFLPPLVLFMIGDLFIIVGLILLYLGITGHAPPMVTTVFVVLLLIGLVLIYIAVIRITNEKTTKFNIELIHADISPKGTIKGKILPVGEKKHLSKPATVFLILQRPVFSTYRTNRLLYEKGFFTAELYSQPIRYTTHTEYDFEFILPENFPPPEQ